MMKNRIILMMNWKGLLKLKFRKKIKIQIIKMKNYNSYSNFNYLVTQTNLFNTKINSNKIIKNSKSIRTNNFNNIQSINNSYNSNNYNHK